jgi:hypothetical protein
MIAPPGFETAGLFPDYGLRVCSFLSSFVRLIPLYQNSMEKKEGDGRKDPAGAGTAEKHDGESGKAEKSGFCFSFHHFMI